MRILIIVMIIILIFYGSTQAFAQNLIKNGDFEQGFNDWSTRGLVSISDHFAYSGNYSFMVSTLDYEYGYIYKTFPIQFTVFRSEFWVYPKSPKYNQTFEFIANWSITNTNNAEFIARIIFSHDSLQFISLDADTSIFNILESNYWNKIAMKTDSCGLMKTFFINDQFVCRLKSSYVIPIETLIVGDVSYRGGLGTLFYDNISLEVNSVTQVRNSTILPDQFLLHQNYPNPFNPTTTIEYELSEPGDVTLEIFNNLGQKIKKLKNEYQSAGIYRIVWDGTADGGEKCSNGIYFYQLRSKGRGVLKRMLMLK
jgi:hypothetical protein